MFVPQLELQPIDSAPSYERATGRERSNHVITSPPFAGGSKLQIELESMAADPSATPLYFDGSIIEGRVLLDLSKKLNVREIVVKVRRSRLKLSMKL